MICSSEVPKQLVHMLPDIPHQTRNDIEGQDCSLAAIKGFTEFTRRMVKDHNTTMAAECFAAAEKLYKEGDEVVKNDVENIFIYALSSFFDCYRDCAEYKELKNVIPKELYHLYTEQLVHSNI